MAEKETVEHYTPTNGGVVREQPTIGTIDEDVQPRNAQISTPSPDKTGVEALSLATPRSQKARQELIHAKSLGLIYLIRFMFVFVIALTIMVRPAVLMLYLK